MKKFTLLLLFTFIAFSQTWGQSISIGESKGWLESAYVKWTPLSSDATYNVYYKAASAQDSDYKRIDGMLIRKYSDYYRADVVGLKAGNYNLKVVPVINDKEEASKAAVTASLEVKAYVREGFAFSKNSTLKSASGAYNDDGTLKSDAQVLYMTAATADTMKLDVIIDGKGKTETRVGIVDILAGKQKGYDLTPLAIRVVGEVTGSNITGLNSSGYIQIKGKNAYSELNITLEGIGDDATANGWAILVRYAGNVEIRNLGIMNFDDDGISLDTKNENVWVHNNDFFYGKQGSGDKVKGDGSLDLKDDSRYVTASYNHFWDSGKASLCGMTGETGPNYITYHHNWFDHSDSRHPRVRTMTVHVYNNYFDGNAKYGIGATTGSNIFAENNYFRNCKSPMLISKQGTDVFYDSKGTFSGEDGGMIKSFGNIIEGARRFVDQNTSATEFDAITVSSRNETVSNTYKTAFGGYAYSNFDTDTDIMYEYTPHAATDVVSAVTQYAGRINGGDFKWVFDNSVDDASYDVNTGLRTAVNNYKGTVLHIGNDTVGEEPGGGEEPGPGEKPSDVCVKEYVAVTGVNTDNVFAVVGSLSKNGGTQIYKDESLAQGLKIDSKSSITFTTTTNNATLLIGIIAKSAGASLSLNGNTPTELDNIGATFEERTVTLGEAGEYVITRNKVESYIYYVVVEEDCSSVGIPDTENVELKLYPNPVADNLYITSDAEIKSVDVYNLMGVLVLQQKGDIRSVDVSGLNKGSYIVTVKTCEGLHKQIVIKK